MRQETQMMQMIPWPREPWNEIIQNLWQGGMIALDEPESSGGWVNPGTEFDVVFSLYHQGNEHVGPDAGVPHIHLPLYDAQLTPKMWRDVVAMGRDIAATVAGGNKVLVRCQTGYNRSGLAVGLALLEFGYSPEVAIGLIRSRRSQWALNNAFFVEYLHNEWEERRLEAALVDSLKAYGKGRDLL